MLTVIFLDNHQEVVKIYFTYNTLLNTRHEYGTWNSITNQVELNDRGWERLQRYRNDVRKLKPMMDKLRKIPIEIR